MSDWATPELSYEVNSSDLELIGPPRLGVLVTALLAIVSAVFLKGNSTIGYLVCVTGSLVGGYTTLADQKRRGNPNYGALDWFRPALAASRYAVLIVAMAHIVRMAINAAHGGGIFG